MCDRDGQVQHGGGGAGDLIEQDILGSATPLPLLPGCGFLPYHAVYGWLTERRRPLHPLDDRDRERSGGIRNPRLSVDLVDPPRTRSDSLGNQGAHHLDRLAGLDEVCLYRCQLFAINVKEHDDVMSVVDSLVGHHIQIWPFPLALPFHVMPLSSTLVNLPDEIVGRLRMLVGAPSM